MGLKKSASGGAPLVAVVQSPQLRDRDHSAQLRRLSPAEARAYGGKVLDAPSDLPGVGRKKEITHWIGVQSGEKTRRG